MGADVGAAVALFMESTTWYVVVVRTILINVALGSLEFNDGDETWVAANE